MGTVTVFVLLGDFKKIRHRNSRTALKVNIISIQHMNRKMIPSDAGLSETVIITPQFTHGKGIWHDSAEVLP